jgi:hypothetical protein
MPEELKEDELMKSRKMIKHLKSGKEEYIVVKPALDYQHFLVKEIDTCAPQIGEHNLEIKSKL